MATTQQAEAADLDIAALSPLFGVKSRSEPDYLEYDIRGRGYLEKCFYNCGVSYLAGMAAGGAWGMADGLQPGTLRVKTNAMMNGFGKRGSALGNATGAMALLYTTFEYFVDQVDGVPPPLVPVLAGTCTGLVYKSTAGPRAILLAGVLGGCAAKLLALSPVSLR